jgi:hypothetical protein
VEKLRIVVGGLIGLYPIGGATWDYIQYPLGLYKLGHDVYYIEDTMQYPVFQKEEERWDDASYCVKYLSDIMDYCGLKEKWAYRDIASGKSFGMSEATIRQIISSADLFINISCATFLNEQYLRIPKRILIDSDPMFTQIQYYIEGLNMADSKNWSTRHMLENHNYLFTFGENIRSSDCKIPTYDFNWLTTRQPVCIDLWNNNITGKNHAFTSVMNWSGRKKLLFDNQQWGQKDIEFEKFSSLPESFTKGTFKVVINPPLDRESSYDFKPLEDKGWLILHPQNTVASPEAYREFIYESFAEFSVAKETYVKSNSGWFSCRSACYLAAGKPVVTQQTGWSKFIPTGEGLHAFTDMESAVEGVQKVIANASKESKAAREIAREYFDSDKVLNEMLERVR